MKITSYHVSIVKNDSNKTMTKHTIHLCHVKFEKKLRIENVEFDIN